MAALGVPPDCPAQDEIADGVERRLGRAPDPNEIGVDATIEDGGSAGRRLDLRTTIGDLVDTRVLEAHDCRALGDAAALLIALSIDPIAVTERIAIDEPRVEIIGQWIAPRSEHTLLGSVRVQQGHVQLRGCARVGTPRIEAPLCGGLEACAMRGDGRDVLAARTAHGAWVAALVGAGVQARITRRLAAFARLEIAVPFARPSFEVGQTDPQSPFTPAPASGRAWLGVEVTIAGP